MKFWPQSVRARLTLWYTLVLGALLTLFAAGSFLALREALTRLNDRFLAEARRAFVSELYAELVELPSPRAAIAAALRDVRFRDIRFAVFDADYRLIDSSITLARPPAADAAEAPPVSLTTVARLLRAKGPDSAVRLILPDSEGGYLLHGRTLSLGDSVQYTITAIQPLHGHHETMEFIGGAYAVAIPVFLLLSAAGGFFLAWRSLRPVTTMSRRASEISASNLHERLPVENSRDELGALASIVNGLLQRVEESFEQQRRFMADASHELRTPVAIMRAEADVALSRQHREEREYRESLGVVQDAGRRLARIVDDLFLLARADSGHRLLHREQVYLDEVVTDAVRAVQSLAVRRAVGVDVLPLAEAPYYGDEELLGRLLINLLDNGIKYSPGGASVTVALSGTRSAYEISVIDSGPGIPTEAQPHIFERFFRVETGRSRTEPSTTSGAGLGLSIALWIAQSHGGRLELVQSNAAAGTEFRVTLPVGSAANTAKERSAPAPVEHVTD